MTDPKGIYWSQKPGTYLQPTVIDTPAGQNANNARMAIWHLGRELDLEIYPTSEGWRVGDTDPVDDGRHDRGAPRIVRVRGAIQPLSSGGSSGLQQNREGERTEGQVVVHIDSHEPFNILAAQANSDIFPNGIRIIGPDMELADDRFNFTTVIRFRSRRWKVLECMELFEGGDEELAFEGAIYRTVCGLMNDRNHERDAKPADFTPEWGPE